MRGTGRNPEGFDPTNFANTFATAVAAAVEQILEARDRPAGNEGVTFAISPALARTDILDYSTSFGAKIFSKATEPLSSRFSIKKPNIRILLNELQIRSETYGWNELLNINVSGPHQVPLFKNMLHTHGQCTLQQIQEDSASYINSNLRKRQNNYQLFVCLNNSVDDNTKRTLANEESIYAANGPPCGTTYLKLLIQKAEVDTRATASYIRRNLTQLDIYMIKEAKIDITKFNEHVNDQLNTLATRGETSSDIIINLLTGYLACSDRKFIEYIEKCKDEYEDGENMTYQSLMRKAERKYQARIMSGEWNALSQEQEEIIALKARIASISTPRRQEIQPKAHRTSADNRRNKKDTSRKRDPQIEKSFKGDQMWRNNKPLPHESRTKVVDGSTWYFCDHHQAWGRHRTEDCIQKANKQSKEHKLNASMALATIGIEDINISDRE